MKVKASRLGYYGNLRRREGDVFVLDKPEHFSEKWMVDLSKKGSEEVHVEEPDHEVDFGSDDDSSDDVI